MSFTLAMRVKATTKFVGLYGEFSAEFRISAPTSKEDQARFSSILSSVLSQPDSAEIWFDLLPSNPNYKVPVGKIANGESVDGKRRFYVQTAFDGYSVVKADTDCPRDQAVYVIAWFINYANDIVDKLSNNKEELE